MTPAGVTPTGVNAVGAVNVTRLVGNEVPVGGAVMFVMGVQEFVKV